MKKIFLHTLLMASAFSCACMIAATYKIDTEKKYPTDADYKQALNNVVQAKAYFSRFNTNLFEKSTREELQDAIEHAKRADAKAYIDGSLSKPYSIGQGITSANQKAIAAGDKLATELYDRIKSVINALQDKNPAAVVPLINTATGSLDNNRLRVPDALKTLKKGTFDNLEVKNMKNLLTEELTFYADVANKLAGDWHSGGQKMLYADEKKANVTQPKEQPGTVHRGALPQIPQSRTAPAPTPEKKPQRRVPPALPKQEQVADQKTQRRTPPPLPAQETPQVADKKTVVPPVAPPPAPTGPITTKKITPQVKEEVKQPVKQPVSSGGNQDLLKAIQAGTTLKKVTPTEKPKEKEVSPLEAAITSKFKRANEDEEETNNRGWED